MKNTLLTSSIAIVVTYLLLVGAICIGSGEPMQAIIAMTKGYALGSSAWYAALGLIWIIRQVRRLPTLKKIKNKP